MKATLLKAVVCVTLVFAGVLNADLKAQDKFVTNDVMTGEQVTSKIIYRYDNVLYRYLKYDFKYDNQNNMVEKEAFKWNASTENWVPYYKINVAYTFDQVVMNYAKWNEKEKAYNGEQEKSVYELDALNVAVAYQNYKKNDYKKEWKIVEDLKFAPVDVLQANSH